MGSGGVASSGSCELVVASEVQGDVIHVVPRPGVGWEKSVCVVSGGLHSVLGTKLSRKCLRPVLTIVSVVAGTAGCRGPPRQTSANVGSLRYPSLRGVENRGESRRPDPRENATTW